MAKQHLKRFNLFPELNKRVQNEQRLEDERRAEEGKKPRKRGGFSLDEQLQLDKQKKIASIGPLHGPFLPLCWQRHAEHLRWTPGYSSLGVRSNLRCSMCSPLPEELITQAEWREKFGRKT